MLVAAKFPLAHRLFRLSDPSLFNHQQLSFFNAHQFLLLNCYLQLSLHHWWQQLVPSSKLKRAFLRFRLHGNSTSSTCTMKLMVCKHRKQLSFNTHVTAKLDFPDGDSIFRTSQLRRHKGSAPGASIITIPPTSSP
jgi:hypothetical protein